MKYGNLVIEKKEFVLLKRMMNLTRYNRDDVMRSSVKKLVGELELATILDEEEMPKDVIRLNSVITIVSKNNGWNRKFKLVFPNESDVKNNKVSILTPMGAAVMGYAKGDSITWEFPSGEQRLIIEEVEQKRKYIDTNIIL